MPKFHSVVNRPADSAAAMAAAKWLRTGSDPTMSGTGGMDVTDDRASLLGGKVSEHRPVFCSRSDLSQATTHPWDGRYGCDG